MKFAAQLFGSARCAALWLLCSASISAWGQQYFDPGVLQAPILRMPSGYEAQGMRLGGFMLLPSMDLATEWNDNIYYDPEDTVSDVIYHVRPKAALVSGWSRHALNLSAWADIAHFGDNQREDYTDLVFTADGRIDVRRGAFISLEADAMRLHESRSSPDDSAGVEPNRFDLGRYAAGYEHQFNRLTAALGYRQDRYRYDNNRTADGSLIDNSDRDRREERLDLRFDYLVAPQRAVFAQVSSQRVRYELRPDSAGFDRNNQGFQLRGGMNFDITGVLTGDLYAQYTEREYEDPRFNDLDDWGFGAGLTWLPTQLTTVELRAEQAPLETTITEASSYVASLFSVRVEHELRRWLLLHARASRTNNDYQLSASAPSDTLSDTRVTRAGVALSYLFNRHAQLTAGYSWESQDANLVLEEYDSQRFYLVLGLAL